MAPCLPSAKFPMILSVESRATVTDAGQTLEGFAQLQRTTFARQKSRDKTWTDIFEGMAACISRQWHSASQCGSVAPRYLEGFASKDPVRRQDTINPVTMSRFYEGRLLVSRCTTSAIRGRSARAAACRAAPGGLDLHRLQCVQPIKGKELCRQLACRTVGTVSRLAIPGLSGSAPLWLSLGGHQL